MIRFEDCIEDVAVALHDTVEHWGATFKPLEIDVNNQQCIIDVTLPWIGLSQILEIGETIEYENPDDHRIYSLSLMDVFAGTDATFVIVDICYSPSWHACEKNEIVIEGGWSKHDHDGTVWYVLYSVAPDRNSCVLYIHCPWDGPLDEYGGRYETFYVGTTKTFGHADYTTEYSFEIGNIYENAVDVIVCDDCYIPSIETITTSPEHPIVGEDVTAEIVIADRCGELSSVWFECEDFPFSPMPVPYTPVHTCKYYTPGNYQISARIDNECGHISEYKTVEVTIGEACPPPVVTSMSWAPAVPNVGEPVQFSATADPGGEDYTITSWYWEFGDGHTGSGQTTEHVYTTQGSFDVSVTVINSCKEWSEDFIKTVTIDEPLGVTTTICKGVEENCGTHRVDQIYGRELFTGGDRCGWLHSFCLFGCESVPWNATDTFDLSLLPVDREVVVVHMVAVGLEPNANYAFNVKWFDPDNSIISNITTDSFTGVYTHDEIEWIGYTTSEIEKNGEYRVEVDLFEDGFPVFQIIKKTFSITGVPCAQPHCTFEVV